jgi:serine/threonine protein phosphatase PrpC
MEDSHITLVDLKGGKAVDKPMMSLFGVFDGHGGKEVAKFVRLK